MTAATMAPVSFPEPLRRFGYVFSGSDRILGLYGELAFAESGEATLGGVLVCATHCIVRENGTPFDGLSRIERHLEPAGWCRVGRSEWRRSRHVLRTIRGVREHWALGHVVLSYGESGPELEEHLSVHVPRHLTALRQNVAAAQPAPDRSRRSMSIGRAVSLLGDRRVAVYTGAGISAASGIPTFAGESSLASRLRPAEPFPGEAVALIVAIPGELIEILAGFQARLATASPNTAHFNLARLERAGHVRAVVTTNLDTLHERAGSRHVLGPAEYLKAVAPRTRSGAASQLSRDRELLLVLGVSDDRYGVVRASRAAGMTIVAADRLPPQFLQRDDHFVASGAETVLAAWVDRLRRRGRSLAPTPGVPRPIPQELVSRGSDRVAADVRQSLPSFAQLLRVVLARRSSRSAVHGTQHWLQTAATGHRIVQRVPEADAAVVLVFAVVHDALRHGDGSDPDHGARAAALVEDLARSGTLTLSATQLELLTAACRDHSLPRVSEDPTIAACWDADRLDLNRIGVVPAEEWLSLAVSRELALVRETSPLSWLTVHQRFQEVRHAEASSACLLPK
jgi:uncharacterized protein